MIRVRANTLIRKGRNLLPNPLRKGAASCYMVTLFVMRYVSFIRVSQVVEDLPFEDINPFSEKTDESLHTLKRSRTTLHYFGIYSLASQSKYYKLPPYRHHPDL